MLLYAHAQLPLWREVACYLGHETKKGTPVLQTTARYTRVSREQVKEKLRYIKG